MQTKVKMTRLCVSPVFGNMGEGDVIKCDAEFAKHLVDELKVAEYVTSEGDTTTEATSEQKPVAAKTAREKKAK
ncbi:hypothetical protein ACFQUU_27180 [Herbaspirillum sp. GCM10030257]|uniref:hypothetical protein n=1 Tax=Herbaspirillum sp. GCM10030257 TaxID=3273393 RepID=UPI0036217794